MENAQCHCGQDHLAILDDRAAMRAAWVVHAVQGSLPNQEGLANNLRELRKLSKEGFKASGAIRTKDGLWDRLDRKDGLMKHPLGQLPADALVKFANKVVFFDYVMDGERYQHIAGLYYGDLMEHGLGYRDLFEVFALFGISAEYATMSSGCKVSGDLGDPTPCVPWYSYFCAGRCAVAP